MPTNVHQIEYDFRYGETYSYQMISSRDLSQALPRPGIYAWFMRVPPSVTDIDKVLSYVNVFFSKSFNASARAYLRETYGGTLNRVPPLIAEELGLSELLYTASVVLSPPIYIGISKNVRKRLSRHFNALQSELQAASLDDPTEEDLAAEDDTARESSAFGRRIGKLFRDFGIDDTGGLFLKIFYQHDYDRGELTAAEHFANRVFVPVCGRR